jgi:S1-C subfamily serine protease
VPATHRNVRRMRNPLVSLLIGAALCTVAFPTLTQPVQRWAPNMATRGTIGVTVSQVSGDIALSFGLPKAGGALVSSVVPDGPAAQAGVRAGDVILWASGHPIGQPEDLTGLVAAMQPGYEVVLEVWRWRNRAQLYVRIGEGEKTPEIGPMLIER